MQNFHFDKVEGSKWREFSYMKIITFCSINMTQLITLFILFFFIMLRKSNFLGEYHLMYYLLNKKVQVSKTTLINLNFSKWGVLNFLKK